MVPSSRVSPLLWYNLDLLLPLERGLTIVRDRIYDLGCQPSFSCRWHCILPWLPQPLPGVSHSSSHPLSAVVAGHVPATLAYGQNIHPAAGFKSVSTLQRQLLSWWEWPCRSPTWYFHHPLPRSHLSAKRVVNLSPSSPMRLPGVSLEHSRNGQLRVLALLDHGYCSHPDGQMLFIVSGWISSEKSLKCTGGGKYFSPRIPTELITVYGKSSI